MPAPPEIPHRDRAIRRAEVQRQGEPEHQRQPDRHVGIAREIEVDLQRIRTGGDPRLGGRQRRADCLAKQWIGHHRQGVRQRHLLRHADHEQHEAARQILPHRRPTRIESELMNDLVVPNDWTGNELRKERHEHAEVEEAVDVPITASQIDQVGDLLEHKEADAERQDQVPGMEAIAQQGVGSAAKEVGIFEQAEHGKVQHHTENGNPPRTSGGEPSDDQPVGDGEPGQHRNEADIPPAVEEQRRRHHDGLSRHAMRRERIVQRQHNRQKTADERLRIEQHRPYAPVIARSEATRQSRSRRCPRHATPASPATPPSARHAAPDAATVCARDWHARRHRDSPDHPASARPSPR